MEKYIINKDISVFYVPADVFPEGIEKAFTLLREKIKQDAHRNFFGISYPDNDGLITYKAAAEEKYSGEAESMECSGFLIKKGEYISKYIADFTKDPFEIGTTFRELLKHPEIDPAGYCLEMYVGEKGVRCMVGIRSVKN